MTIDNVSILGRVHRVEANLFGIQLVKLWDGKTFDEIPHLCDSIPLKTVLSLSDKKKQAAIDSDKIHSETDSTDLSLVKDFTDEVLIPSINKDDAPKNYDAKDKMRIEDILKLSPSQRQPAAEKMAKLIKDPAKMKRRTAAAKDIAGETSEIFKIFSLYAKDLGIDASQL